MPELPEVETIKRGLAQYLVGHTIEGVEVLDPPRFEGSAQQIIGVKVLGIRRRGKGLIVDLSGGLSLVIHLKMTGQVVYLGQKMAHLTPSKKVGNLPSKHTRVIFTLDNQAKLFFNDIRKFGWIKLLSTDKISTLPFVASLGPEPIDELTLADFSSLLRGSKQPIKTLLLDQHKIAGIGNIYANDALFMAKIDPRRQACSLNKSEAKRLFESVREVLLFSIEHGAASDATYVNALGQDGRYQEHFQVYRRAGEKCDRCGTIIQRITLAGRGTFFCEGCQK